MLTTTTRSTAAIVLLATQLIAPHATGANRAAELAEVVAAERAFAARAQVVNARQAFVEFFAPDAILFAPFAAPAFPRLRDSPDWSVNIQWRPAAAAISGAGDMGYTTGPSEYRRTPTEPPVGYGHYTSVWQRQPDGRFLVRIDVGVDHAAPEARVPDWSLPKPPPLDAPILDADARAAAARELQEIDARLGASSRGGPPLALSTVLADEARWHRSGRVPVVGRAEVLAASVESGDVIDWVPEQTVVAASGDFGYTFGRGRWRRSVGTEEGDLAYLNIWQRRDGAWRLLVHVSRPVDPPR
jgi:ketosteroid isomerase-like protein